MFYMVILSAFLSWLVLGGTRQYAPAFVHPPYRAWLFWGVTFLATTLALHHQSFLVGSAMATYCDQVRTPSAPITQPIGRLVTSSYWCDEQCVRRLNSPLITGIEAPFWRLVEDGAGVHRRETVWVRYERVIEGSATRPRCQAWEESFKNLRPNIRAETRSLLPPNVCVAMTDISEPTGNMALTTDSEMLSYFGLLVERHRNVLRSRAGGEDIVLTEEYFFRPQYPIFEMLFGPPPGGTRCPAEFEAWKAIDGALRAS